jgi:hypothetical protein
MSAWQSLEPRRYRWRRWYQSRATGPKPERNTGPIRDRQLPDTLRLNGARQWFRRRSGFPLTSHDQPAAQRHTRGFNVPYRQ